MIDSSESVQVILPFVAKNKPYMKSGSFETGNDLSVCVDRGEDWLPWVI